MNAYPPKNEAKASTQSRPPIGRRDLSERTVKIEALQIERKTFVLALMQNECGQFLRITEESTGRRNKIIIPAAGLKDFHQVLQTLSQLTSPSRSPRSAPAPSRETGTTTISGPLRNPGHGPGDT